MSGTNSISQKDLIRDPTITVSLQESKPLTFAQIIYYRLFLTPLAPPAASAQQPAAAAPVVVKKWSAVAVWSYGETSTTCSICHNALTMHCLNCNTPAEGGSNTRVRDCMPAWGTSRSFTVLLSLLHPTRFQSDSSTDHVLTLSCFLSLPRLALFPTRAAQASANTRTISTASSAGCSTTSCVRYATSSGSTPATPPARKHTQHAKD